MYCELSTTASKLMYLWRRWDDVGAQWCTRQRAKQRSWYSSIDAIIEH